MYYCVVYDAAVPEVIDDDLLEEGKCDCAVPDAFRIDDNNWPTAANAEARSFSALDSARPEEQAFTLEQSRQKRVERAAFATGRAEVSRAHQHVSRVRLHGDC